MKHTVSDVKQVSSATDNATKIVAEFCHEVLEEAKKRQRRLSSIADLESILDSEQLAIAGDARAGIRHLVASVLAVSEHHQKGAMAGRFDETLSQLAKIQDEAESTYRWLHALYARD
ncbi:hypothetical protein [Ralstonia pickettii]|uniref:Uncharacterized protein n=1 Tax=Ralstonia pickettii TaxID=329 RepID=A0AAW4QAQ4_RALPI|nr:hypothetical protein [Ralstonia pickettii]MBA9846773.1 hypothetical protein [Ralstonia pickettii]MBA9852075.1 hypothetical protein [Ralstonia pickettii]MBA9919910.1 hypothetical protein [Ralstonia pickettii]MBA9959012.1 hypothetical protein [Ralstonia pickettii]MBA9964609.1 hypothetical protein [Ralstonia pickettii]